MMDRPAEHLDHSGECDVPGKWGAAFDVPTVVFE
jgi:hypothetical protein